jgi:glutamate-1-semialdehyde 2,1-aminomutase
VEGEERIDFLNNYTSLILGHANPQVTHAAQRRMALGSAFTMPTEAEVDLAVLLASRVSYIDRVRFCNSGSEAVLWR